MHMHNMYNMCMCWTVARSLSLLYNIMVMDMDMDMDMDIVCAECAPHADWHGEGGCSRVLQAHDVDGCRTQASPASGSFSLASGIQPKGQPQVLNARSS